MDAEAKNQMFSQQIRRKQRKEIMAEFRKQINSQLASHVGENIGAQEWQKCIKQLPQIIPYSVCQSYDAIDFQIYDLEQCLKGLNASHCMNLIFAAYTNVKNGIHNSQFYKRSLIAFRKRDQHINFSQPLMKTFKTLEDIYIFYWVSVLNENEVNVQQVEEIKAIFLSLWQSHHDVLTLGICAAMMKSLLDYEMTLHHETLEVALKICEASIGQDYSKYTYLLVKHLLTIKENQTIKKAIFYHQNFGNFILQGMNKNCLSTSLYILTLLMKDQTYSHSIKINYGLITESLISVFFEEDCTEKTQMTVLFGLYNITQSELADLEPIFSQLNFDALYDRVQDKNLLYFLDFCAAVLVIYPQKTIINRILNGQHFQYLEVISEEIIYKNDCHTDEFLLKFISSLIACTENGSFDKQIYAGIKEMQQNYHADLEMPISKQRLLFFEECQNLMTILEERF